MKKVEVRYNYRLRVRPREARFLQGVFDSCPFVWNQALGRWSDLWRYEGVTLGLVDADKELTDWRSRFDWLAAQPSVPEQQVLRDLYRSIGAFFDKSNSAGRPTFKKRRDGYATARWTKNGFTVTGTGLGQAGDRLAVAVGGGRLPLRVIWSRPLPSKPTSVTVRRDPAGHYWASLVVRIEVPDAPIALNGRSTGLDVGLTTFATTEDPDSDIENPRFARRAANARARSQRNMARKQTGSKHRTKAKRHAARVAAKVANQGADFHHKAARSLVRTYDRIGVEDLSVMIMSRRGKGRHKAGRNRSIADAGWSQFRAILQWQAIKARRDIVVLPAGGTTQICSCCGAKAKPRIELSDRVYRCCACGLVLGRDRNAARNLNPDRIGAPTGGSEPDGVVVPRGNDGKKPKFPAGILAARAQESHGFSRGRSQPRGTIQGMDADLNPMDTQVEEGEVTEAEVTDGGVTDADIDAVDALLDEVEQSLARLDAGTYGRCEVCGEPIDDGRLAELPTARTCGTCPV
jgi:putative transposase